MTVFAKRGIRGDEETGVTCIFVGSHETLKNATLYVRVIDLEEGWTCVHSEWGRARGGFRTPSLSCMYLSDHGTTF